MGGLHRQQLNPLLRRIGLTEMLGPVVEQNTSCPISETFYIIYIAVSRPVLHHSSQYIEIFFKKCGGRITRLLGRRE